MSAQIKKIFLAITLILASINIQALDVIVESNKLGCAGLLTNIIQGKTQYVTISKLPKTLPESLSSKPYPNSKIESKALRFNNAFFSSLKSVEYIDSNSKSPLAALKNGELYNFVVTKDEVRFASTSRAFNAKNIASKHALLAKNTDEVFYAGEAWLENGILVVNHNSGTFRPNPKYLSDVALYFQAALGVEKVTFTDILPPPGKTLKQSVQEKISNLKAYVKSKITSFEEFFVGLFARDEYFGKIVAVDLDGNPGKDIVFTVERYIGSGFFGVVHQIKIQSMSAEAKTKFPTLLSAGNFRTDLVVKFPHNISLLNHLPRFNVFDKSIIKEANELDKIKSIVTSFEQAGADILFNGKTDKPFLIKQFVTASSVQKIAKSTLSLTEEQRLALKRDIFDMAVVVDKKLQKDLDIKAENIAWDEAGKRFIMYEMGMKTKTTGFYIKDGFEGYVNYVNQRLHYYGTKRNPASAQEIKMCSDNVLDVPVDFQKTFYSDLYEGEIDLKNNLISFRENEIDGCFRVESINFLRDKSFINLSLKEKGTANRLDLVLTKENDNFLTRFTIYVGSKIQGISIFSEVEIR